MNRVTLYLCAFVFAAAMMTALSSSFAAVTWVEGEDFSRATNTVRQNATSKPLCSGGRSLFGPALDKANSIVEYRFTLTNRVPDARLIFRYARLHWRQTMKPATVRLELVGPGDPKTLEAAFVDTKGWGSKPSDWRLLTVDVGDLPAGEWMLRMTSLGDNNSINMDGFFVAASDFSITAAELSSLLRLKIDSHGYVGVRLNSGAIRQDRTKELAVANRLFMTGAGTINASIADAAGKSTTLATTAVRSDTETAGSLNVFALSGQSDGTYRLTIESTAPKARLEMSLTLLGRFLSTFDARLKKVEAFTARLPETNPQAAKTCLADLEHCIAFLKTARDTMSQSVVQPSTNAWRKHVAEQERLSDPAPLALNMVATMTQCEQTMARIATGDEPYEGRTGQFRRAFDSDATGDRMIYRSWVPSNYKEVESVPLILMLHGGGGDENYFHDMGDGVVLKIVDQRGYLMLSPKHGRRRGRGDDGSRAASDKANMDNLLGLVELTRQQYPKVDPDRIYVTGISMGAGVTYRMAAACPDVFAAACPVAGRSNLDLAERFATTPLLLLHGEGDTVNSVDNSRRFAAKMEELGLAHELRTFPSHGHGYHPEQYLTLTLDFFERYGAKTK